MSDNCEVSDDVGSGETMAMGKGSMAEWESSLTVDRPRLVRYCWGLTRDVDAAEDVAQETLYEAWRHLHQVHDPAGLERWLRAIARNVWRRWAQRRGRELAGRTETLAPDGDSAGAPALDSVAGDVDLEVELERKELAALLDQALSLLPPDTRAVLVQRYVQESPQGEIALRLGLSEGAVAMRLQRGKLALRRVLTTELSRDALAYGLIHTPEDTQWRETRVWCPSCGRRHLEGLLDAPNGELLMRCPGCVASDGLVLNAHVGDLLAGLHTYKPALSRCLDGIHEMYRIHPVDGATRCPGCRAWIPIMRGTIDPLASGGEAPESIYQLCPTCGWYDRETWHSLTWSVPEVQRFWREHPRMRFLPVGEIEAAGLPAVVARFESLDSAAWIEVVALRDTCRVLSIDSNVPGA